MRFLVGVWLSAQVGAWVYASIFHHHLFEMESVGCSGFPCRPGCLLSAPVALRACLLSFKTCMEFVVFFLIWGRLSLFALCSHLLFFKRRHKKPEGFLDCKPETLHCALQLPLAGFEANSLF